MLNDTCRLKSTCDARVMNEPLRIAMLSIHSSPLGPLGSQNTGGMSVYVREIASRLGDGGNCVDIYTYTRGSAREIDLRRNVRLIHLAQDADGDLPKEQLPAHLSRIFEQLERYRQSNNLEYDLIHSHYWVSGVVGAMAQARWRCPHLTMFHTLGIVKNNTAAPENEPELRIAHERWLAKVADRIIVPAERERQNLLTYYHAPAERVSIIPCGVDLEAFKPRDRLCARRMLGLDADAQIALYVGRFAPLKGLDRLFTAVARLKERFPRLHLLVIGGDGPDARSARELQRLVRELGIGPSISFLGRIDQRDLPPYYSAADLLAVTSHYESFGLVVLEALACGTPVLSTPVGAVEAIIRNGVNGEIVASPAVADVAAGMARLLSRPPQQRASTRRIRASVENYSWDKVARAVRQSYAALLMDHDPAQATEYYTVSNVLQS